MTGIEESVRCSPSRYQQMREVINLICPDMQKRVLEIKRQFLDVVNRELSAPNQVSELGILGEVAISNLPHIVEGHVL